MSCGTIWGRLPRQTRLRDVPERPAQLSGLPVLAQDGYDCYNFSGGYRFYESVLLDRWTRQNAYPCGVERP